LKSRIKTRRRNNASLAGRERRLSDVLWNSNRQLKAPKLIIKRLKGSRTTNTRHITVTTPRKCKNQLLSRSPKSPYKLTMKMMVRRATL